MSITVKEIAQKAGVSIATVSHVINKTRYVSPDLVKRVETVLEESGYDKKVASKTDSMRMGRLSEVAFVAPNVKSTVYASLATSLLRAFAQEGFSLSTYLTDDDLKKEKGVLLNLMANKRIAGIVLVPVSEEEKPYRKLIASGIPLVCLERTIKSDKIECILSENMQALKKSTEHLIRSGHENIALLLEKRKLSTAEERLQGYRSTLEKYGIQFREDLVIDMDVYQSEKETIISRKYRENMPTAFIAGGNTLTLALLKSIKEMGMDCPKDVSIIGFGDDDWCELVQPPLTTLKQNTEEMANQAARSILDKIYRRGQEGARVNYVPVELTVRESTQTICRGPFGEKAISPEQMVLTDEEI